MSTVYLREQAEKGASLTIELLLVRPQVSSTALCYFPTGCNFAASGYPKGKAPPSAVYPGAQIKYSGQVGVVPSFQVYEVLCYLSMGAQGKEDKSQEPRVHFRRIYTQSSNRVCAWNEQLPQIM